MPAAPVQVTMATSSPVSVTMPAPSQPRIARIGRDRGKVEGNARILCFPGRIKPHETGRKAYRGQGGKNRKDGFVISHKNTSLG